MSSKTFDDFSEYYEVLIDWPQRLAHETPFYRRLFTDHAVHRVADVACGTGHHAALFHAWGLQVDASDISPTMIQRARDRVGEPEGLRWSVRGFDQPAPDPGTVDAAVCVGNSLALAPDLATVERAIHHMLQAVRPAGVIVVHLLNLWRLEDGPCLWQKCRRAEVADGEVLITKGVHRCGRAGFVNLLVATLGERPVLRAESARFLGLEQDDLQRFARRGGAREVHFFGGYQDQPYDARTSTDLLLVATR
jgi:SAM-dependent methyltransferase